MKDFITIGTPSCQANAILFSCPNDAIKYHYIHYSSPSTIFTGVSPQTTILELFTYNQAIIDLRCFEVMKKELHDT